MLNISPSDVSAEPFPHVVAKNILDDDFYVRLRTDYPTAADFEIQKGATGLVGSRTGQGFDIYRGDSEYERLVGRSDAWAEFDAWINSRAFVDKFLELFGQHLDAAGCRAEIAPERYRRELVEGREGMASKATMSERIANVRRRFMPSNGSIGEVDLFTRLDIHKALKGYNKEVHCDRANRLCSLVLYFVDAKKAGVEGGTLTIHEHKQKKAAHEYERHPKPEDAPVIATVEPMENTGVFFVCCNNSYHGVTAMKSNGSERDYLYINISGDVKTFW